MPESNQSIKSFNIIDNEEYPNKSSQKSVNNQSSYVYSKSSRKPSVEKF